ADAHRLLDDNPVPAQDRNNDMALVVEGVRAIAWLIEGHVLKAAEIGADVLRRSERTHGRGSVCANMSAACVAEACYELDRIDEAREAVANRTGILQSSTPAVMVQAALTRARLDLLQVSPEAALAFLDSQVAHYCGLGLHRLVAHML